MPATWRTVAAATGLLLLLAGHAPAQFTGYEFLSDWGALPNAKTGMTPGLASSYDREGWNRDWNNYENPSGFLYSYDDPHLYDDIDVVIAELTGPGVITRFWMPHAAANFGAGGVFPVTITVDGTVVIDTDTDILLGGNYAATDPALFKGPLVSTQVGGQVCYEPIVFQNSLTIESKNWNGPLHFYQYNTIQLPAGTSVTPYTGALTPEQQTARSAVETMIANVGANPAGGSPSAVVLTQGAASIPAGSTLPLATLSGSGRVRCLNVRMAGASDEALDSLRVRVRYDGAPQNAIDVPVSHFFGAGHERVAYQSLPVGTDGPDGFYCYWPMPYRRGAVVELYNAGASAVAVDAAAIEYESTAVPDTAGALHAVYNETTAADHEMLSVTGQGHYVGNFLWEQVDYVHRWVLEGDETITVDGVTVLQGTGLEDAYNGGYYYNHVAVRTDDGDEPLPYSGAGPYSGLLRMNFDDPDEGDDYIRTDQYRWLIGDPVPFDDSLQVTIQNYAPGNAVFGSAAYYYLLPIAGDINLDNLVNALDIDAIFDLAGAGDEIADLDDSGLVDQADADALVRTILGTEYGDVDLDRDVDVNDLGVLATFYGTATGMTWANGDFDGDGDVDVNDLGLLATSYGQVFTPPPPVGSATPMPEPATIGLLVVGMLLLRRHGRHPSGVLRQ